jgi:hypothetical protein
MTMKKWILLSGLVAALAASQVASFAGSKDEKPKCPPTTQCPCR